MSEHMSWHRFYSAIYDDCRETVDQALHYLHTRALTTCLESSSTSLELAAKLGRTHILQQILHSNAFRALDKFFDRKLVCQLLISACAKACSSGHLQIVKTLLDFSESYCQPEDADQVSQHVEMYVTRAARTGAQDIVHFLLDTYSARVNTQLCVDLLKIAHERGDDYSWIMQIPDMNEKDIKEGAERLIGIDELFDLTKPIDCYMLDYSRPILVVRAAATGRVDLLAHLYNEDPAVDWPSKRSDFEAALDMAVQLGKIDICRTMIDNKWVDMKDNWSDISRMIKDSRSWVDTKLNRRLYYAVQNDRTETAAYLMDTFLQAQLANSRKRQCRPRSMSLTFTSADRSMSVHRRASLFSCASKPTEKPNPRPITRKPSVVDDNLELICSLLKAAICNNNELLTSKILHYASAYPGSGSKISECFNMAVTMGLPRLAMMFSSRGYKTTLCVAQRTHGVLKMERSRGLEFSCHPGPDCFHASITDANVVITELLLGEGCQCWNTWTRFPMLTQTFDQFSRVQFDNSSETRAFMNATLHKTIVQSARFAEIMRLVLDKFRTDQAADASAARNSKTKKVKTILEHAGNEPWVYATCFNSVLKPDGGVFTRHILTTWYDFLHVTPELGHNSVTLYTCYPFDLTERLHAMCGSGLRYYTTKRLMKSMSRMSVEHIQMLHDCATDSGLVIRDSDDGRTLLEFVKDKFNVSLKNNPASLGSNCRLSVRRAIRAANPVGSLEDRLLSLSKDRILPAAVVGYLLFRYDMIPTELRNTRPRHNGRRPYQGIERDFLHATEIDNDLYYTLIHNYARA